MLLRTAALASVLALSLLSRSGAPEDGPGAARVLPAGASDVERLAFLAGEWSGDAWGGRFHAHYTTPQEGRVISYSRLVKGGKETYYEFEVFEERPEGLWFQPFPGGKRADGFALAELDDAARKVVFENPAKDWPTRVVYQREADERLVITLTDPHGGDARVERFDLRRSRD